MMIPSESNLKVSERLHEFVPELPVELPVQIEKRYCVGYYNVPDNRQVIIVLDKLEHKIVYKGNSKSHKDHHQHIWHFYGKGNCEWRSEVNPQFYEGL